MFSFWFLPRERHFSRCICSYVSPSLSERLEQANQTLAFLHCPRKKLQKSPSFDSNRSKPLLKNRVSFLKNVSLIPDIRLGPQEDGKTLNLALLFRKSLCYRLSSHAALSKYQWGIGDIYAIPGGGGLPFIKICWPDQSNQGGVVQSWVSARF